MQQSLAIGPLGEQDLRNTNMPFTSGLTQRGLTIVRSKIDLGTLGKQDLGYANVTCPSGPVQRGPAIIPPCINRNTGRKQNLDSTDLSCLGYHMQQNLAVGPLGKQDLGYANVTCPSGPVQRGPAIAPPRIDRHIRRKQNLDGTDLSCLGCRVQQSLAVSPLGKQDLGYANVTCPSGPVQRGPAIAPPRIDRHIRRKQNLDGIDLSCFGCRVQQSLAVSPLNDQDPDNFDMPFANGPAQRGLTIVRPKIDLGILGKQDLDDAGVSRPSSYVQRGPAIAPPRIDRHTGRKQNLDGTNLSCLGYYMQQSLAVGPLGE